MSSKKKKNWRSRSKSRSPKYRYSRKTRLIRELSKRKKITKSKIKTRSASSRRSKKSTNRKNIDISVFTSKNSPSSRNIFRHVRGRHSSRRKYRLTVGNTPTRNKLHSEIKNIKNIKTSKK